MRRSYRELSLLPTLKERFEYLKLDGQVGGLTFGGHRYLNQDFYNSKEWKQLRHRIIVRDGGCELGLEPYEIKGGVYIHHINPIEIDDVLVRNPKVLDPDNLVCVSFAMHQALHYGDLDILTKYELPRRELNDTCPWKK